MVQISKLFVAFFLSAVTIPLVVALPTSSAAQNHPTSSGTVSESLTPAQRHNRRYALYNLGKQPEGPGEHPIPSFPPSFPERPQTRRKTTLPPPKPKTTLPPPTAVGEHSTPTEPKKSDPVPPLSGTVPPSPGGHTTPSPPPKTPPPTSVDQQKTSKVEDEHRERSPTPDWEMVSHEVSKY